MPYFLQIIHIIKQIEIDVSRNCFKKSIELTEIKENVNSQIAKYNLDIILKYFILYLLYTIKNISSDNYPLFLNNFLVVQESMNEILNSDVIFKSFTQNSKLLTLFVKEYSNLILEMNKIFEKCGNYITQKLNFKENLTEIPFFIPSLKYLSFNPIFPLIKPFINPKQKKLNQLPNISPINKDNSK